MDYGRLLLLYSERSQNVIAGSAEFMLGAVRGYAAGADYFQLGPTFYPEIHASWVLELAFRAFHRYPHRMVEGGGSVKTLSPEKTPHDGMNNN